MGSVGDGSPSKSAAGKGGRTEKNNNSVDALRMSQYCTTNSGLDLIAVLVPACPAAYLDVPAPSGPDAKDSLSLV